MAYFQLNNVDLSIWCNKLEVKKAANYNAQTNAGGNTVVDFINHKRTLTVGVIPIDEHIMYVLQTLIGFFNVSVTFLNPETTELETINCIIPESSVEYYTIQANNITFKAFTFECVEL